MTLESIFGGRLVSTRGRVIDEKEFSSLVAACLWRSEAIGFRDAAIIGLIRSLGLTPTEVSALEIADWDAGAGVISVTSTAVGGRGAMRYEPPPSG